MKVNSIILKIFILLLVFLLGVISHMFYKESTSSNSLIVNNHDTLNLNFEKGGIDIKNQLSKRKERSVLGVDNKSMNFYYKQTEENEVCLYFFDNGIVEKLKNFKDSGNNSFVNFHNSDEFLIDNDLSQCLVISGLKKEYILDSLYQFSIYCLGSQFKMSRLNFDNIDTTRLSIVKVNSESNEVKLLIKFNKQGRILFKGNYESYKESNTKAEPTMSVFLPFKLSFFVKNR